MKVLVVGNGAREDALTWALARSPSVDQVYAVPGNAGTASRAINWELSALEGVEMIARCRAEGVSFVVIGPETSIAAGVSDRLREAGIPVFAPSRAAGRLETSKLYAKKFMERCGVPTARYKAIYSLERARQVLRDWVGGCVVKADGLAAGKGVVVTDTAEEALTVLERWYSTNTLPGGGNTVVLEERLEGRELSVFAIGDGAAFTPFASACDYKRAGDGDTGPNTGGMGAYSPPHGFPADAMNRVQAEILDPMARGLRDDGESYRGVLYCGLMWTAAGPKVIEFNVRFGDPETQVMMPRVEGDFAAYLYSAAMGKLDPSLARVLDDASVGVVLATKDYPVRSTPIEGLAADLHLKQGVAFWGASRREEREAGAVVHAGGGRVLTVVATGATLAQAREQAYAGVSDVAATFGRAELSYRTDIALGL